LWEVRETHQRAGGELFARTVPNKKLPSATNRAASSSAAIKLENKRKNKASAVKASEFVHTNMERANKSHR